MATSSYATAVSVLGLVLFAGALLAARARRSALPVTALALVAGFALGAGGTRTLIFPARSGFVLDLATTALVVILFRDGLEVDAEMLQGASRPPLRKLVIGMPITTGIVAVAGRLLTGLGWTECFLLGALLAPTDPVLSSVVVTDPRVPREVRHSLNLESGLNDGLALAPVLALLASLDATRHGFDALSFVVQDVGLGLVFGVLAGLVAAVLLPRGEADRDITGDRALLGLGAALATYGGTLLAGRGNGLIAVFVCAIVLGVRRPELREAFGRRAHEIVEVLKLGVFLVFGSLLTGHGLLSDGLAAIGLVAVALLLARPVAVLVSLTGTSLGAPARAFMAWFGPKGIATMTFALLVLGRGIRAGPEIFDLVSLTVCCSVVLHGLTDTPGAGWLAARSRS